MANILVNTIRNNPYPYYRVMRRVKPLLHIARFNMWVALRYDDVRKVLSDYTHFSSNFHKGLNVESEHLAGSIGASLVSADPPIHTKLRGLVSKAFTTGAVARLEPRIEQLTHRLLDQVCETGRIDLIKDLAYPLPVIVIAEMLGIPPEDREMFKHWSDEVVATSDRVLSDRDKRRMQGTYQEAVRENEMHDYLHKIVEQRRADPRDDLISGLVAAEIDGERLTAQEVLAFISLLLVAGNETTTNLIGNAIMTFLDHPREFERLQADMTLLPTAIEEVLRYRSPVQATFRVVAQDVELGGQMLREGQWMIAGIGSANRDESKFKNGNTFDITRTPNPHIAFGFGIHHCLGAPLARLESRVALRIIIERLQNIKRADRKLLEPAAGFIINGVKSLPLTFTPSSRAVSK